MLYDIDKFIDKLEGKDYFEVLPMIEGECARVEKVSYNRKGAVKERQNGSINYTKQLKGLLYFLRYSEQPTGISKHDFLKFKKLAEVLVVNSGFNSKALDLFR